MIRVLISIVALLSLASVPAIGASPPTVIAASSLQEALTEAADAFARQRHPRPVLAFAASSALARQVEAGAPADLFVSADEEWMDVLAARARIVPQSRRNLASNALVLVELSRGRTRLAIERGFPLARALGWNGRLALADPASVPAGKYARAALTALGVWPSIQNRIAASENVRAALALVERGQAPLGIVYRTDALASGKVRVVGTFPPASHPRILYPLALIAPINGRAMNPEAEAFRRFLLGPQGRAILARRGFGPA